MAATIGRRAWIGIALEDSPGSPEPPTDYLPFLECDLRERIDIIGEVAAKGIRDEQGDSSQIGRKWGEGSLRINLDSELAPYLLGLAMGNFGTPTANGGGVYTHTFTRKASNTPKTASIVFDRVNDRQIFTNSVVDSLELSFSDGVAELNADLISKFPVATTSGTLTTTSGNIFTFRHATIKFGTDITDAETGTEVKAREFSLVINNNAEPVYVAGSSTPDQIIVKNFNVEGSLRLLFEDTTQRDIFKNLTKKAMIVTFTGRGIGGGFEEYIKFKIYKLRFQEYNPELPIDDIATEGIDFVAEYSTSDAKTIEIEVRNRKASY